MKINATNSYNKIYEDKEKKQKAEAKSEVESKEVKSDSLELSTEVLKYTYKNQDKARILRKR